MRAQEGDSGEQRWNRPDATMSLLADLMTVEALDPGYAEAAARNQEPRQPRARRSLRLAVLVVIGLLLAAATLQARRAPTIPEDQRGELVAEVQARTAGTERLRAEAARLRRATARSRAVKLARSQQGKRAERRLDRVAKAAAARPITGSGLAITVSASPDGDRLYSRYGGRIYDRDLQQLVNGLWAAGATAIAINGQRLTSMTAIRAAGQAILVDYRPINPPYVVKVVGDPNRLHVRFAESKAGRLFRTLESVFAIHFEIRREEHVRLPGASALRLRYAEAVRRP